MSEHALALITKIIVFVNCYKSHVRTALFSNWNRPTVHSLSRSSSCCHYCSSDLCVIAVMKLLPQKCMIGNK